MDAGRPVLVVEFFRRVAIDIRLAAAVIANQDDVLEPGGDGWVADRFEHGGEQLVRQADRAGQRRARVVRRVWQYRQRDRVPQLQGDGLHGFPRHQVVAAVDILRAAMLGPAGIDERGGLPGRQGSLYFGPRHHFKLDVTRFARWGPLSFPTSLRARPSTRLRTTLSLSKGRGRLRRLPSGARLRVPVRRLREG